ncbi:RHS repeat-associated core domain-containing protein [Acidipropionibacterium acidipropionici]|uniref:RHS repeat-associated core domain-containing protein n=1 Tax=Acidipropionibacterium acidipropionici TaxID=1748 RepID=A0AAC9FC68_9ACTN|nr:RHS repeat-associated core domain-containing protein [Acidipropionibacterium acidipropionici]AMS05621.1 hypothetical protein AXH35_09325 [Acidipropionibacterium acidipropionici]AOZ47090.1 hypothetical protein A8L58_10765 [Acidipropionibacterium acidipropionici]AZP36813.1 RHS repeat-associated core domain-containing protein [Acidipropionibacterium acidipropionici]
MDHDPATGRLSRLRLDRENAAKADADITYAYTDSGLTRSISAAQPESGAATDTQCFGHDFAGRLATAYTVASASCPASVPAAPSGPAPYSLSWAYDAAGNRTRQDDQVTGTVTTWTYPGPTGTRPHAPVSQTMTAPGATPVVTSFGYDAGGNTTGRVSGSVLAGTATGTVENQYDAENHLAGATNTNGNRTSAYAYDADGDRAAASIGGVQTVYLPGGTELSLTGGQVTATRIYTYQGTTIARRTATGGSNRLAWCWTDGAGSDWQVDAADTPAPLARRADPFGGLRGPQPAGWSGDRGMAAGITDTVTGTLRLGARDYDPVTGAFTQPDPILDTSDPLQWNPYSYGTGNPVDRPDPSGLAYCTSTACGGGTTGSMNETGGSLHETHRPTSRGGGGSRSGGGSGSHRASRYHGGGYNGGGHRSYRYTTPRRAPARHAVSKARYRPPARPRSVTPLPPAPDPYFTCQACTFIWIIPIAVGITEAAIDTGITIGIGISIGILADKIRERIHIAHQEANTPTPAGDTDKADEELGKLTAGGHAKASELDKFGREQGWNRERRNDGLIIYTDENKTERLKIKKGSSQTPGSEDPHVEMRKKGGHRMDPYGNDVTKKSDGNHTPIEWDLD